MWLAIMGNDPPSPMKKTRNVLDATQALEKVASLLMEALINIRGEKTPSGRKS
jgi:hypothetical protein